MTERTGSGGLPPPELPERWLNAHREDRLVRWLKRGLVLVLLALVVLVALNWWIVRAYLTGREEALAQACADSRFASAAVTAAGGAEVIDRPDHPALDAYRGDIDERTAAALRVRDHASLLGDDELARAATASVMAGPFEARNEIARAELRCARYLGTAGTDEG